MTKQIQHMCQSVRGALQNWKPRDWRNVIRDDQGRWLTPAEAKFFFMDELAKGHEVLPFGEPCEGFDYSGGGCPGHPVLETEGAAAS